MPGLFDSNNPIGGILQGIGGVLSPQAYEQNATYNAYRQAGMSDADARLASVNPQAYQQLFQQRIFQQQIQDPAFNKALYGISPGGQKEQYGVNFGPPVSASGVSAPIVYGQGQGPHVLDVNAGPSSGQQSQPSQQPAGPASPQSPMDALAALGAKYKAQEEAAVQTAKAQPDLPVLQSRTQQLIQKLQAIHDSPELPNVVGGPLGIKGRTGPLGQAQSDLVNDIQDANNALQGDLFTSLRATSGRGVSPGALKEMRITDLQGGRTGTLQGYKDNIDKTIKQIQEEYGAAWEARGKPDAYKPQWQQSQPAGPAFHEGQTAINRQTGQRITYTNGRWQ